MNIQQKCENDDLPDIRKDVNLRPYNTLKVEAYAGRFLIVKHAEQLRQLYSAGLLRENPLVLGGGSNILFRGKTDRLVIKNEIRHREIVGEDEKHILMNVGAGENWHDIVTECVDNNRGGVENLALIPGTVGAAPVQNIGAYGVELKDSFVSLQAFDMERGGVRTFTPRECEFAYRDSVFKSKWKDRFIITSVTFKLTKKIHAISSDYQVLRDWLSAKDIKEPTLRNIYEGVVDIRTQKLPDPTDIANAGSFFKNPVVDAGVIESLQRRFSEMPYYPLEKGRVKIPAGWLIEKTGWKGVRVGRVGTYENQALVIVNHGGATGDEIWELSCRIVESVRQQFGIELVPEVNIIGSPDEQQASG